MNKFGHKTGVFFRFGLIDLFFAQACFGLGMVAGWLLSAHQPGYLRLVEGAVCGLFIYFALIYPFYRGLKLYPMYLPPCPCCGRCQEGFYFNESGWPRVSLKCPTCDDEFVIWHNGKPGDQETWEKPVLALKWPYAFGRYKRVQKPESGAPANLGSAGTT
jgi:hypothetical protein